MLGGLLSAQSLCTLFMDFSQLCSFLVYNLLSPSIMISLMALPCHSPLGVEHEGGLGLGLGYRDTDLSYSLELVKDLLSCSGYVGVMVVSYKGFLCGHDSGPGLGCREIWTVPSSCI